MTATVVRVIKPTGSDRTYHVVVDAVFPPVPTTRYDWAATLHGHDEGDPIGRGATREDAIRDLLEQLQ